MRILYLGYKNSKILEFLQNKFEVICIDEKLTKEKIDEIEPDNIVVYGYRYILESFIVEKYDKKIINLHISFLPWNRGAYPNFWSFVDNTPKGVSIHYIDKGIDTGDIILQKEVQISIRDTLQTSYACLKDEIENLFIQNWEDILYHRLLPIKQTKISGSFHTIRQTKDFMLKYGIDNWDIPLEQLMQKIDDMNIINEIERIRNSNNKHWMDLVRLSFELDPVRSRDIFKKIKECDQNINLLLSKLADNES
jgi:methionyl-tRNA formyltransferase